MTLSRSRPEFESPWGHKSNHSIILSGFFYNLYQRGNLNKLNSDYKNFHISPYIRVMILACRVFFRYDNRICNMFKIAQSEGGVFQDYFFYDEYLC